MQTTKPRYWLIADTAINTTIAINVILCLWDIPFASHTYIFLRCSCHTVRLVTNTLHPHVKWFGSFLPFSTLLAIISLSQFTKQLLITSNVFANVCSYFCFCIVWVCVFLRICAYIVCAHISIGPSIFAYVHVFVLSKREK